MVKELQFIYGTGEDVSFIIRYFEDFYCTILQHKSQIISPALPSSEPYTEKDTTEAEKAEQVEPNPEADQPQPVLLPEKLLQELKNLLERQAIDAARFGGEFAAKYYREAEFVMVALADEIFLHMDWKGKGYWQQNILESQMYDTHRAGESFFEKLEEFLKVRDPSRADIAMLYLLALGLGFKGKYRDRTNTSRLDHYRRELFIFIHHRDPMLYQKATELFPETYQHTLDVGKLLYLYDFRPVWAVFASFTFLMLLISYGVWYATTHEIQELVNAIISTKADMT